MPFLPNLEQTLNALKKEYENMKICNLFFDIFDIFAGAKAIQRFDGYTLRAPKSKKSVFKFVNQRISSLYMYGDGTDYANNTGALGMGKNVKMLDSLQFIGSFISMSAGFVHCAAINGNGNVFVWGKGEFNQLGLGDKNNRYIPTNLSLFGEKAIMLALGQFHTLILTERGRVYSFGTGLCGKLGHGNEENVKTPKMIKAIAGIQIVHISANQNHSMLVSKDGKVYAFGKNKDGICGLGKAMKEILLPTMINLPSSMFIIAAECGQLHSVFLSSKGETLSCGKGNWSGHGDVRNNLKPKAIKSLQSENIKSIATGYKHTLCLNEENKILSFGEAKDGQLGNNDKNYQKEPKLIKYFVDNKIDIGSIYANCAQSAAVDVNGKDLYVWGKSFDAVPRKMDLSNDEKIVSVALGNKFMGILSEPNEECKESEYVLKDGEEIMVKGAENKRSHQIYVQNVQLFGDSEWVQIQTERPNHSLFPYFDHKFVDNLVMNNDKTMIELIKYSEIDSVHYSDILSAEYFLYLDICNESIIGKKNEFLQSAKKYAFDKMDDIKFKIGDNVKYICIYVKPKNVDTMYLVKNMQ